MTLFTGNTAMTVRVLTLFFALWSSVAFAQPAETVKAAGDSAYMAGRFDSAIGSYESVLTSGVESAEVLFNLGNAYFKANRIAPAILNYERALKLAPDDEDIRFNLRLASLTTKDRIEEMPRLFFIEWWEAVIAALSMDAWAWITVLSLALAFAMLAVFRLSSSESARRMLFYGAMAAMLTGLFAGYAAQQQYDSLFNDDRAVVFRPTLNVKSAPEQTGKDLFVVHEGLVVRITDRIGDWYRIRLTDGNVGWVPSESIEGI
jgi:tetratricopeptide (TPR) repeat protein